MTIYFNPRYDSSVFLTATDCGLGKVFCGRNALLSELELRAGLTCAEAEHADRVISYIEAMKTALGGAKASGSTLFFEESFERDDFGTAELMLGWRDALVKAGWDGKSIEGSEKIDVLSRIETSFECPGAADRWRTILTEAAKRPILRSSDRIMVQCLADDLEPSIKRLFDSINSHYATPVVEYHSKARPISEEDKTLATRFRILEFADEYEAHEWIASQNLGAEDVVAEADEALLGDILHTLGKPGIGADDEGIGAVMRLLPLGLSLFRYPADITCLQSYLQSPKTPLAKLHTEVKKDDGTAYYPKTVSLLLDHICSEGGLGKGWDEIREGARFDWEGNPLEEKDRKAALEFIGMWDRSKDLPKGEVCVANVTKFVKDLLLWSGKCIMPDNDLNTQFQALHSSCAAILRLLSNWNGKTIPVEKLYRWAGHICTPVNISSDYARLGCMNTVGNVANIYSGASHLVWFASTTDITTAYDYEFLSRSEIDVLRDAGALFADKEQMSRLDKAYKLEGLSRCADITIVTCRRISGVETMKSALLSEISACIDATPGTPVEKTATGNVETDFGKKAVHNFDPKIIKGFKRKAESYSSINTLLMSPLDYLLDYVKGYGQYGIEGVADVATVEGTVAHAYMETLGEKCGNEPNAMLAMHKEDYDDILSQVISEKGLILCTAENRLEEKSFRVSLKESVEVLLDIITQNGLAIEGFEYELTTDIPPIGPIYAKIDCLLQDPKDGKYVIIDFKYNGGKTYQRKIADNRELQLAIYRKVVEKNEKLGEVKFVGYYAIPRKTIFTPKNTLMQNSAIEEVEQENKDIFDMAARGYVFRWDQLRKGILEEGEGLPLEDFEYSGQVDLYPLDGDYNEPNKKGTAYGNKNIVLKGGLN